MQRRHDLDWLRVIAFALLVLYHVGMYYVSWDWHVKSPQAGTALEPFMLLTSPWRMSLLFLISGVATAFMLQRPTARFLRRRSWQLLLPLLFGMLVIVPPQSYLEVVEQLPGGYGESYLAFYARYLSAYQGFCDSDGCLILPTWNHLWFLPYLWCYTLLAWLLWRLLPAAGLARLRQLAGRILGGWRALLVPIAILAAARLLLATRFEQTHALIDDWYSHAEYAAVFLLGFLLAFDERFWERLQRLRWTSLVLATGSYAVLIHYWYFAGYGDEQPLPELLRQYLRVVWAIDQWCATAALLGFAYRWRNADSPLLRYLTVAVFPVYILHQTVIVVLAHALKPLGIPATLEAMLLIAATFALCFAAYALIRRSRLLRPPFGLRSESVPNPPLTTTASEASQT
ncbi:acyltransferase family protein [Stenotrophomonas sp. SY1]|uniref:acyltransferase family protein n=1 Tax=Stenotrophomonas sp. SY1 TaxID=477235 RepID=UPI001E643BAA|nr:acyltransferase family protein [Stenotrophomonas sp. SY1]MCD9087217.1 acyltransferase family protein [Stenotrophomonas sp. SY1]